MAQPKVLITGGSGYLGQFLIHGLQASYQVVLTYSSRALSHAPASTTACQIDLPSGQAVDALLNQHGPFDCVINCAAISQPGVCEKDPDAARAVNVPTALLQALERYHASHTQPLPLFIHISTDQVYDGSRAMWRECDECAPVNAYGRSKLEAERAVQTWPGHSFILRSSIIYGPTPPDPVPRTLFLQFLDSVVSKGEPTPFFQDEWRCPIYVQDIVRVVTALMQAHGSAEQRLQHASTVLNLGGPERLNRVEMAMAVATYRGLSTEAAQKIVLSVPSASVQRGVASPADISMDITQLVEVTGVQPVRFADALPHCLG